MTPKLAMFIMVSQTDQTQRKSNHYEFNHSITAGDSGKISVNYCNIGRKVTEYHTWYSHCRESLCYLSS